MIGGLLNLRRNLRKNPVREAVAGAAVFVLSTLLAVVSHYPYFYSTFVIGVFLFCDGLGHIVDPKISFTSDLNGVTPKFFLIITLFVLFTDYVGGQIVFQVWHYPGYRSVINWILLYAIVYPVGGLSVIAMYRLFDALLRKWLKEQAVSLRMSEDVEMLAKKILRLGIIFFPLFLLVPLGLYFSGLIRPFMQQHTWYSAFYFAFFLEWMMILDMAVYLYGGRPVLLDLLEGNARVILAAVLTGLLGAVLHEFINTFAGEWIYDVVNFPVTSAKFLGIPVMVLVAWIPMTIVCVEGLRLAEVVGKRNFLGNLRGVLSGKMI